MAGNADGNSVKSPILPYLRSIDGFSTTDAAFANSIAGGITSMQVLPGSGAKELMAIGCAFRRLLISSRALFLPEL